MPGKSRAVYNHKQMQKRLGISTESEDWEIADYRALTDRTLLMRISALGEKVTLETFLEQAASFDSPSDMANSLYDGSDRAYLLLFELWRRNCPHRDSLAIFCDQLDHLITNEVSDEIEEALVELEDFLDASSDSGLSPIEVFATVTEHMAQDLEEFLHEFISTQIDQKKALYASELIDNFYEYIHDKNWFDFLRLRLLMAADPEEGTLMAERIVETLTEEKDIELFIELLAFLSRKGSPKLFFTTFQTVTKLITTEEEFRDILKIAADFYRGYDLDDEEQEITRLLKSREGIDPEDQKSFRHLIKQLQFPSGQSASSQQP